MAFSRPTRKGTLFSSLFLVTIVPAIYAPTINSGVYATGLSALSLFLVYSIAQDPTDNSKALSNPIDIGFAVTPVLAAAAAVYAATRYTEIFSAVCSAAMSLLLAYLTYGPKDDEPQAKRSVVTLGA
jgi:hypothetical protein